MPEVIDGWFDSGSMPFAQWGYPHVEGSRERFEQAYPADFICEAIDQTRGWFYTLMAIGTLVFDESSYRNVLCLGHILAEDGRKMSKHLGNILEPIPLMDEHGADAVRWFMAAGGSPWAARRVGHASIQETVRKVLLTYWNTVSFQVLYANLAGFSPHETPAADVADRPVLDRWALSEAHRVARDVTSAYEQFDTQRVGTMIAAYVDDLSNWYVRRSRRRFWSGDVDAFATLHECLYVVTLLMAPMAPFITERVWQDLFAATSSEVDESVHLASWPRIGGELVDEELSAGVRVARRLVELGRAARAEAKVRTRQPLSPGAGRHHRLPGAGRRPAPGGRRGAQHRHARGAVGCRGRPGRPQREGQLPGARQAVRQADATGRRRRSPSPTPPRWPRPSRPDGRATVMVDGDEVEVLADEVIVSERPREGWSVVNEQGETVALDLHLTPELVRAGLAREAIRLVQEARKSSGFEVSDRIALTWWADGDLGVALAEQSDLVASEVLATSTSRVDDVAGLDGGRVFRDDDLGLAFTVTRA